MNTLTIPAFSAEAAEAAQRRLDNLAKVPRSLGRIEELAVRLAGITGKECPAFPEKSVVLFAADHDIALQGVSATGQEVTEMQVRNFVKGGGTINAFCRNAGARLSVVDVGVKNDLDDVEGLVRRKVMHAARDFSEGPAMTREEALACVQVGIDMAREEAARGVTLLAAGEMGIGNTSPSSAIAAVLTGASVDEVTGIGSGIPSERVRHKAGLIRRGIAINRPNPSDAGPACGTCSSARIRPWSRGIRSSWITSAFPPILTSGSGLGKARARRCSIRSSTPPSASLRK